MLKCDKSDLKCLAKYRKMTVSLAFICRKTRKKISDCKLKILKATMGDK